MSHQTNSAPHDSESLDVDELLESLFHEPLDEPRGERASDDACEPWYRQSIVPELDVELEEFGIGLSELDEAERLMQVEVTADPCGIYLHEGGCRVKVRYRHIVTQAVPRWIALILEDAGVKVVVISDEGDPPAIQVTVDRPTTVFTDCNGERSVTTSSWTVTRRLRNRWHVALAH